MPNVLMVLNGSKMLSNSWKQELTIKDDGVYGETLVTGRRTNTYLPFDRIAQVNIIRQTLSSDIEVINNGGSENILIRALNKEEAEQAKNLIYQKISETKQFVSQVIVTSESDIPAQIKKLAELKETGILSEEEFNAKKAELLARM